MPDRSSREWEENESRLERAEDERERFDRFMPVVGSEHEEIEDAEPERK